MITCSCNICCFNTVNVYFVCWFITRYTSGAGTPYVRSTRVQQLISVEFMSSKCRFLCVVFWSIIVFLFILYFFWPLYFIHLEPRTLITSFVLSDFFLCLIRRKKCHEKTNFNSNNRNKDIPSEQTRRICRKFS